MFTLLLTAFLPKMGVEFDWVTFRVETIFPRNPYLFTDMTWGLMYVLHGLAGVGLIALVMVHVYFAVRPEKLDITKSMIFGSMTREFYLEHYDPRRWTIETEPPRDAGREPRSL
jgi:hypothetical protein